MLQAQPEARLVQDRSHRLPLHTLLESNSVTGKDALTSEALLKSVQLLLATDTKQQLRHQSKSGHSPLHKFIVASPVRSLAVWEALIGGMASTDESPLRLRITDDEHSTPLMLAITRSEHSLTLEEAMLVLRLEPDAFLAKNVSGLTPLQLLGERADRGSNWSERKIIVELLRARPQLMLSEGVQPQWWALQILRYHAWYYGSDWLPSFTELLSTLQRELGDCPLTRQLGFHLLKMLLGMPQDEESFSAVILSHWPECVHIVDDAGRSPLHHAAKAGSLTQCTLLMQHGASILLKDSDGFAPLALCSQSNHRECHAFLSVQQRLRSMFRGRFELDDSRQILKAGAKIRFAVDCGEQQAAGAGDSTSSVEAKGDGSAVSQGAGPTRTAAVLKFFASAAEYSHERAHHSHLSQRAPPGHYVPRLLASYEPLPGAVAGSLDSLHCLAMECGTESVADRLQRKLTADHRPLSAVDVLPIAAHTVAALQWMHGMQGRVHGDVKAENVILFKGQCRLRAVHTCAASSRRAAGPARRHARCARAGMRAAWTRV